MEQAKAPRRLPVVLTQTEVAAVLEKLPAKYALMARLIYGCGLRLMECLRLRVKDVDFGQRAIIVREGKGFKDRVTMLPEVLITPLKMQLWNAQQIHQDDLGAGFGEVYLPYALARKYTSAGR